jgi:hypothetical protein
VVIAGPRRLVSAEVVESWSEKVVASASFVRAQLRAGFNAWVYKGFIGCIGIHR